jgi:hypothetical protein
MSAAREPDHADFDLDRFINLFDEAMTSKDPRVIETLRSLMMIVVLTRPETSEPFTNRRGPLRRLFDDVNNLTNRIHRMEEELRDVQTRSSRDRVYDRVYNWDNQDKFTMAAAAAQQAHSIDEDFLQKLNKSGVWSSK